MGSQYMLWCVAIIGSLYISALIPGLRAKMGAGFSRMNDLTIIQTTQVRGFWTHYVHIEIKACEIDSGVLILYV